MFIDLKEAETLLKGLFLAVTLLIAGLLLGAMVVLSITAPWLGVGLIATLAMGFTLGFLAARVRRPQKQGENPVHDGIEENIARWRSRSLKSQDASPKVPDKASPRSGATGGPSEAIRGAAGQPSEQASSQPPAKSRFENPEITGAEWPIRSNLDQAPPPPSETPMPALAETPTAATRPVGSDRLIDVWQAYWENGDGHFNAGGLKSEMDRQSLTGKVYSGSVLGLDDSVLGVDLEDDSIIYLLPDFNKPPSAVSEWFEDQSSGSLTALIKSVDRLAQGILDRSRFQIETKGIVR